MGKVIAVSGKGGVGKTLVAALLVRALKELNVGSILAIDADPDSNLAESMGLTFEKTVGNLREELTETGVPPGVERQKYLEGKAFEITVEAQGYDLLVMGRPEGPGCYCAMNHMLREIVDSTTNSYDYTVIDAEAGLEHLSRRTTQNVDTMLIVTDASKRGFQTATRIGNLAKELEIEFRNSYLILNRMNETNRASMEKQAGVSGFDVIGSIPDDEVVAKYDLDGKSLFILPQETGAYESVKQIAKKLT